MENSIKIRAALASGALALAFAVTGCGSDATGDPGKVVNRDHTTSYTTSTSGTGKYKTKIRNTVHDYDLEIQRTDGSTYWAHVTSPQYDRCPQGAEYPACAND